MVTPEQIEIAKKHLTEVEALAAACDRWNFPFAYGCTILQKETGGDNIYGHDRGGVFTIDGDKQVTEQNFQEFIAKIGKRGAISNGVGPMQITYKGHFPIMEELGLKPWVPADNIEYGIRVISADYRARLKAGDSDLTAFQQAAAKYNLGKFSKTWHYGKTARTLAQTWRKRLGETVEPDEPANLEPVTKPEPGDKDERVTFEGKRTTTRTRNMFIEARRLFREEGGGEPPSISQGGYNAGGVSASAGTHDKDAADFSTRSMPAAKRDLWIRCLWRVGFPAWSRVKIDGLWPAHTHGIPAGGDLSPLAARQVQAFRIGRDGLRGNARYPGILESGLEDQTWERYLDDWKPPTVSLQAVAEAFANRSVHTDVKTVQRALNRAQGGSLFVDGDPGPRTKEAYTQLDPDGIPDATVLASLSLEVTP